MRDEYNFSGATKNPYVKKVKKQITINIDADVISYFKDMSTQCGIPYQTLINMYLTDCAKQNIRLNTSWK